MYQRRNRGKPQFNRVPRVFVGAARFILAKVPLADGSWRLRPDMEPVLRAMQRSSDRQKTLYAHGELVSDPRLGIEAIDWRKTVSVEG